MAPEAIDVHVVEDHPLYRAALADSMRRAAGVRFGVAVGSVEELLAYRVPAGVVILDLGLPGLRGPAAVLRVVEEGHRVLVVSAEGQRVDVLAAIGAGARGYLTKDSDAADVVGAVHRIAEGGTFVSPLLASFLLDSARPTRPAPRLALSEREREILALLAAGERDLDIARTLSISIRTVRSHLDRIRDKTGRRRRPELTRLAIELGVLLRPGRAEPSDGRTLRTAGSPRSAGSRPVPASRRAAAE